ncbi:hypothetical protein HK104_005191 [Borealophlyctis nickersoniae]|nr:hypothetical protein HK104_005191 [Borealophlyctis nickersoniae]
MSKKGKKGTKVSLNEFLADTPAGAWADDIPDLPTGPAASSFGDSRPSYGERGDYRSAPSTPRELPDRPPYTVFLGNLSYDASERSIGQLFNHLAVKSIRLVKDHDDKPKGFGYTEFDDLESLKGALELNGSSVEGRSIRIDVAEGKSNDRPRADGRPDRSQELEGQWRRAEPLRPSGPSRSDSYRSDRSGFDDRRSSYRDDDRSSRGSFRRDDRDGGFGASRFSRDSDRAGSRDSYGRGGFDRPGSRSDEPMVRKRLELAPRSVSVTSPEPTTPLTPGPDSKPSTPEESAAPKKPKANPFGAAKPRDENEIMKQIEERRAQREAEKKRAEEEAAKAKAEEEAKRKEEEAKRKEEEATRKEEEAKRKEEEAKKVAEEAEKKDKEAKDAEEVDKAKEEAEAPAKENGSASRSNPARPPRPERKPSAADTADSWRRAAPLEPAKTTAPAPRGRGHRGDGPRRGGYGSERGGAGSGAGRGAGRGYDRGVDRTGPRDGPRERPARAEKPLVKGADLEEKPEVQSKNVFDLLGEDAE